MIDLQIGKNRVIALKLIKDIGTYDAFAYIMETKKYLPILNDLRRILAVAIKI